MDTSSWKEGDVIVCITPEGQPGLTKGAAYVIKGFDDFQYNDRLRLVDVGGEAAGYFVYRFMKVNV